jgi:hypothetical protein
MKPHIENGKRICRGEDVKRVENQNSSDASPAHRAAKTAGQKVNVPTGSVAGQK